MGAEKRVLTCVGSLDSLDSLVFDTSLDDKFSTCKDDDDDDGAIEFSVLLLPAVFVAVVVIDRSSPSSSGASLLLMGLMNLAMTMTKRWPCSTLEGRVIGPIRGIEPLRC